MSRQYFVTDELRLCTERFIPRISYKFFDFFGLSSCALCKKYSSTLCSTCSEKFLFSSPCCSLCGKFSPNNSTHHNCLDSAKYYSHTITLYSYTKEVKALFALYKYSQLFFYQKTVEKLVQKYFESPPFPQAISVFHSQKPILLTPVPMTVKKQEERGFSVPYELSIILGRALKMVTNAPIYVAPRFYTKDKETVAQAKKQRNARLLGLYGVFTLSTNADKILRDLSPGTLVVVDDIVTTGATTTAIFDVLSGALSPVHLNRLNVVRFSFAQRYR